MVLGAIAVMLAAIYAPLGLIIGLIALVLEDIQKFVEGQPSLIGEVLAAWKEFVAWFEALPGNVEKWLNDTLKKIRNFVDEQKRILAEAIGLQDGVDTASDLSNRAASILSGETDVSKSFFGRIIGFGAGDPSQAPTPNPAQNHTTVNQEFNFPGMQFNTQTDDPQKLARELKRYLQNEIGAAQTNLPSNF